MLGDPASHWIADVASNNIVAVDVGSGEWRTWCLRTPEGQSPGIHDLSFGWKHELLEDANIVAGGGGNRGLTPMVPNQRVSLEDARLMAEWVLSLAPQ